MSGNPETLDVRRMSDEEKLAFYAEKSPIALGAYPLRDLPIIVRSILLDVLPGRRK